MTTHHPAWQAGVRSRSIRRAVTIALVALLVVSGAAPMDGLVDSSHDGTVAADSANRTGTVDDFERSSVDGHIIKNESGNWSISSNWSSSSSRSLQFDGREGIIRYEESASGLTPRAGDTITWDHRIVIRETDSYTSHGLISQFAGNDIQVAINMEKGEFYIYNFKTGSIDRKSISSYGTGTHEWTITLDWGYETLSATLYDANGQEMTKASVTADGINKTGFYYFRGTTGSNAVKEPTHNWDNVTIVSSDTTVGTVSDGSGSPLRGANVTAYNASTDSEVDSTTTDSDGEYRLSLPQGQHDIKASADGYESTTKNVYVPEGGTTVNFTLTSPTTITDPDPPDGATVSEPPVELSVLANSENDSVTSITVDFYKKEGDSIDRANDTQIGSSTVSPGERAAAMWDPPKGTYEWYAVGTADSGARDTGGPYALGIGEADIIDGSEQPPDGAVVDPVEDVELAVDVRVQDDATVEFYEYETGKPSSDPLIGTQSVSSGTSTASTTWKSENRSASEEWYAVLKDSTGTRDTAGAFAFGAGGVVVARDAETGNVIDDRTTRFDTVYPGGSQTFDRVPANLSLSEVNAEPGESIRIDVRAQDYYERTIEVSGKQADADVYLERGANWSYNPSSDNPDETASVDDDPDRFISRFTLKDQTGRYPPSDTKLTVRADIDDDGQTDLVHSSTFGAANRVDVRVKRDRRYQLVVENGDGDSRGLGGWTATEPETTTLTISRVTEDIEIDQGYGVDAEIDSGTLKIYYRDYETRAETLDLEIREYPDGSYLENRTLTDVTNATVTIALNESQANKIWQIDYDGTRVGVEAANISGQVTTSPSGRVPLPVGSDVLIAGALIILAIVGALFTGPLSAVGSVAMVGVAGVLYFIGWLPINAVALWVAGIVAVGSVLRSGGGRLG